MHAVSFPPAPRARSARWLRPPSARVELAGWLLLAALAIGLRVYVAARLPTYVWTRDSGSYVDPATDWLQTGKWITNPRRGPVYSLFIAGILQAGGSLCTVANAQAVIGFFTAALTVAAARVWLGRGAFWPLAFVALGYAAFPLPVEIERLIRNETLLTLFCTVAFGAWRFVLREETSDAARAGWMTLGGLAAGLLQLLKGIFPVFPLMVLGTLGWHWRRRPALAALLAACFLVPFVAPTAASRLYDRLSGTGRAPEPEDGIMFYGRTAQWTVLDGGIAPDIKALIRPQAQEYAERFRQTGKLDNNEIVKRTVVPSLKRILQERDPAGFRPVQLNRFCWRLGLEAAAGHPFAYLRQWVKDLYRLNFVMAHKYESFPADTLRASARDLLAFYASNYEGDKAVAARAFQPETAATALQTAADRHTMRGWDRLNRTERNVRLISPIFLTTLLLPLLWWVARGGARLFWLTAAALWFSYLMILSTVGRPLDRYMMPVAPLVFWTLSAACALAWRRWLYPDLSAAGESAVGDKP